MISTWDFRTAAANLDIELIPFTAMGAEEARGYSRKRQVAIRPGEPHPVFVGCHEFAHVLLGHTFLPRLLSNIDTVTIREIEAHAVALVMAETLELVPGSEYVPIEEAKYLLHYARPRHITRILTRNHAELTAVAANIYQAGLR